MSRVYCVTISGKLRHILGPKEYRTWCGAREFGLITAASPAHWSTWPLCSRCDREAPSEVATS